MPNEETLFRHPEVMLRSEATFGRATETTTHLGIDCFPERE